MSYKERPDNAVKSGVMKFLDPSGMYGSICDSNLVDFVKCSIFLWLLYIFKRPKTVYDTMYVYGYYTNKIIAPRTTLHIIPSLFYYSITCTFRPKIHQ